MFRIIGMGVIATLLLTTGCTLFESSRSTSDEKTVVGKIGGQPVTLDELTAQYNKSSAMMGDAEDADGLREFLPLYMDYRLKLAVAEDAGYMEDPEILAELEQYERQSAYPYWLERHIRDRLLDELYERSKELVHAQHILISIPENAAPADTAWAYEKLMEVREQFLDGEAEFMDLSNEHSSRQRGQSMGGDLGYFSAGWAVKPFEDAVYSLKPGEVSMPVRSSFGYHLIYLLDRRETGPDKHFSHIYFMTRRTGQPVDSIMARAEIAHEELEQGDAWSFVVERHTEDEQSRLADGNIGWVEYGRYDHAFTDTIMQLENPGDYTRPFVSRYGIHIVRLDSIRQPSEAEHRSELAERLKQLPRYRENEQAVLDNAAEIGNARFHTQNLNALEDYLRSNEFENLNELSIPDSLLNKPVFSFHTVTKDGAAFVEWLAESSGAGNNPDYHHRQAQRFRDHVIDDQLLSLTREHFSEFKELSKDYHTGLAVFRVNEDSIWTYARQDTARLRQIFEEQPDEYHYDRRYRYVRLSARADSTLDMVRERIVAGEPLDSIRNDFANVVIRRDIAASLENEPYSRLQGLSEGEFSEYFDHQRRRTVMYLAEELEARPMTFDEAYNRLVTEYQPIREREWLEAMRAKYRMEYYPEALKAGRNGNHD
ncbi:peptidylprolyl isomerase [Balneolales bacterium ANBcel1]|nr:peptidylprolyl isomerase [Balneolales bacterium ANBcel1]